jgi:Zinc-finger of C2H2 type
MPRASLPPALKVLKTFAVVLTKTTQEELWSHFEDAFSWYRKRAYYLIEKIEAISEEIDAKNPFSKCSWRNTCSISAYPTRKYDSESPYEIFDDAEAERYNYLFKIRSDLERCGRILGWADDEEYCEKFAEFTFIADDVCYDLEHKIHCLAITENDAYVLAKHRWQKEHKNEIDEQQLAERHKGHRTKKEWIELFQTDPVAARWCNSIPPNDEDTCKYCIADKERRAVEDRIAIAKHLREQKEAEEDARRKKDEEYELLQIENERKEMEKEAVKHTCKTCDYTTSSGSKFDVHLASKEHTARLRSKALYCEPCDTQSRSQLEHENHCNSVKHKKKIGEIVEPTEYRCEPCNYVTPSKHLFKQHTDSRKHKEKEKTPG